jgi:hypothetical protein
VVAGQPGLHVREHLFPCFFSASACRPAGTCSRSCSAPRARSRSPPRGKPTA